MHGGIHDRIVPMTVQSHPSSRTSLKLSNPLPWKDCYTYPASSLQRSEAR
ncbi:hypothetical protein C8R44DRAFT_848651 [Mycena epipterygia]|nr:hypothetical protein C8R44DRAFT_848651 [Mycena epipterygia]